MKYPLLRCVLAVSCLAATHMTQAAQSLVYGDVLAVEPITEGPIAPCNEPPKPGADAGLVALLSWDLARRPNAARTCRERQAQQTQGYRVTYRYAGREFVDILPEDPGSRITLTLDLQ